MKTQLIQISTRALFLATALGIAFFVTPEAAAQRAEDIIFAPSKIKTIPGHGMSKAEYPYDEGGKYRKEWVNTWAKSAVSSSTTVKYPIPKTSREHSNYVALAQLKTQSSLRQALQQQKVIAATHNSNATRRHAIAQPPKTRQVAYSPPMPKPQPQTPTYPSASASAPRASSEATLINNGFIGPYDQMVQPVYTPVQKQPAAAPKPTVVVRNNRIPTRPQPTIASTAPSYHKVKSGDTLYNISKRYGTTVDAIKHANGLTSDLIRVGQSLRLAFAKHALGVPRG